MSRERSRARHVHMCAAVSLSAKACKHMQACVLSLCHVERGLCTDEVDMQLTHSR